MRPSLFQSQIHSHLQRCDVCQWRCELAAGDVGRCLVRRNIDGIVQAEADGMISAAMIAPIEDQRLWHFFPDAQVFNVGSFGFPYRVEDDHPQAAVPDGPPPRTLPPERIGAFAQERLCRGVVWTYNDPAVTLEWTLDGLKLARAASRFTAITSSGFFSAEAVHAMGPYLDGLRLDMFGFSAEAYGRLAGLDNWRGILAVVERLRANWNTHVELLLELHAGVNDDEVQLGQLATWAVAVLGSLTPLHLVPADSDADWERAATVAHRAGLAFVYGPDPHQPTRCPRCRKIVIERGDGPTQLSGTNGDVCGNCFTPLGLRTSLFRRQTEYHLKAAQMRK